MEWWQRLHLHDNPFERLKGMPQDLMDTLVETKLIKKYDNRIENPNTLFKKVFIIYGSWGSGKTTLFSFIANKFRLKNIKPICINLSSISKDGGEILENFKTLLYNQISKTINPKPSDVDILNSLVILKEKKNLTGYGLFIDELHRNRNLDAVFDFIKLLQGLTQYIFDNDIKMTVFIAGRDDWEERFSKEPEYGGTIDKFDRIEPITEIEGYNIVTKRLETFAEKDYKKHKFITPEACEKIYSGLSEQTPRELLRQVGRHFENLPDQTLKLDTTNVIREVDPNTIRTITDQLHRAGGVHKKLRRIKQLERREEQERSIYIIAKLFENRFIDEKLDEKTLKKLGFNEKDKEILLSLETWDIVSIKSFGIQLKGKTLAKKGYTLNSDITNLFNDFTRYGVSPEDYLIKIYIGEETTIETKEEKGLVKSEEHEKMREISTIMRKQGLNSGVKHISRSIDGYIRLWKFLESSRSLINPNDIPGICIDSIDHLFMAFYIFEQSSNDAQIPISQLRDHVLGIVNNEDVEELYSRYENIKSEGKNIDRTTAGSSIEIYFSAMKMVVPFFHREIEYNSEYPLDKSLLTTKDFKKFREISELLKKNDIPTARRQIVEYFEKKMRVCIASVLHIQYGDSWLKNHVENNEEIRKAISKNIKLKRTTRTEFQESENRLDYADQQHLLSIIQTKSNWNYCFNFIFEGSEENKRSVEYKWNQIYLTRIDDAHFHQTPKRYLIESYLAAAWIIEFFNKALYKYLSSKELQIGHTEIKTESRSIPIFNIYFRDEKICEPEQISYEDIVRVLNHIKKNLKENKINIDTEMSTFITYAGRKMFSTYAFLIKNNAISLESYNPNFLTFFCNYNKLEELTTSCDIH